MHEDNQFGHCGWTLLWISDHIFHWALLSLPSLSLGYRRRNREESISNNWFYYGTAHDVHIDLLLHIQMMMIDAILFIKTVN